MSNFTLQTKIKSIVTFIIYFISIKIYACSCISQKIEKNYIESNFIAKVSVQKVYKSEIIDGENYFKVDVLVKKLYKGNNIKSIYFYGNREKGWDSACYFYIEEGEQLLIYSDKKYEETYKIMREKTHIENF